ncbi:sperm-tail PG-rich repeat protein (macronuclear) [Tetrahymena thermophila SB210]|uniref:Sperm-tail PG-rich repeat protein n=1 Tax=Tetrahymena thermophila (strain SB210) TaxID=312017 RepID=I7LTL0_TETTS|nr:sperm-tail PG-rich repeat protein [Tetrahymena thermophila SB210]EAR85445.1 sperm-tail PG-rich repeat protein [Tetrahymena thermophila SB210]|eukprot:XP_001033108.1 sperm-tail PG-rich repeat protein [Tetrahymena thermophila SB210]
MSVTVSSGFQICNSPLNNSKSKQMYSFPKETRFKNNANSQSANVFYDLPSMRMTRSTAIGYGSKYDFTKQNTRTPAPNAYEQKMNTIQQVERKGWSFGLSRENMAKTSGPLGQLNLFSPGPGTYQVPSALSKQAFTLRQRTASPDAKNTNLKSPGPGAYASLPAIKEDGKYFLSKYKSSGCISFSPSSSQRFPKSSADQTPGPGTYKPIVSINPDGRYFVSKFKSSNSRSFTHSKRITNGVSQFTPGPGSYRLPSEFGYYESKPNKS